MKLVLLLLIIFPTLIVFGKIQDNGELGVSCDTLSDNQLIDTFLCILETDQSCIKKPVARQKIFIKNFNTIISITKCQGFPRLKEEPFRRKKKNCISIGSSTTFIHIIQNFPELMLNLEIISLFKKEIIENRLDSEILRGSMQILKFYTNSGEIILDSETSELYIFALSEWNLELK